MVREDKKSDIRINAKKILRYLIIFFLSLLSIYFLCDGDRELYAVPKDVGFYKGVFFFLILVFVLRKVSIKSYEVWASLLVGLAIVFLYLRLNNINSTTYGEDFFRVVLFIRLSTVLFVSLMVDSVKNFKMIIKKANVLWFVYVIFAVYAFISRKNAFPIIIPAFALLTTYIDNEDRKHVFDLFSLAYYSVFLYMSFLSFVFYKDVYAPSGRFVGAFLSEGTGGSFCGGAFIVGLYFVARFYFSYKKKWYNLVISLILLALTIYPNLRIASRSCEAGVLLAIFGFFMFVIGKKDKKSVLIRVLSASIVAAVLVLIVVLIASNANKQIQAGIYNAEEHSYLYNHISFLMNPAYRSGYFGDDSILNALDSFSSERLKIWDASLKLVEPFGKEFNGIYIEWNDWGGCSSPHSFFIWMLVSYGGICGVFLFSWYIGTIVLGIKRSLHSDISGVLPLLWFLFCVGPFGGLTMYWNAPIATILCLVQYSICFQSERNEDECHKCILNKKLNKVFKKVFEFIKCSARKLYLFLPTFVMTFFLIKVNESQYQVEKDYCFYIAAIAFIISFLILAGVNLKDRLTFDFLLVGVAGFVLYKVLKNIGPETYGEFFYKVVLAHAMMWIVFGFAIFAIIRNNGIKCIVDAIKTPFFWLSFVLAVVWVIINKSFSPLICPIALIYMLSIDRKKWIQFTDTFVASFYISFAVLFIRSLFYMPNGYDESGRYIGLFLNNSKLGALCSMAIICSIYFYIRTIHSSIIRKYKIINYVSIFFMLVFATYAFLIVRGRTGELGLVLGIIAAIVFLHRKEKKRETLIRFGIMLIVSIVVLLSGVLLANVLQSKIKKGEIEATDLSYTMAHIAAFANKDSTRGLFEANTLANSLDELSAQRLSTWKELGTQIIPFGHIEEPDTATHSTYLFWLVQYGMYPGMYVIVWFISFIAISIILVIKKEKTVYLSLLWVCFYAGVFLTSNEYWNSVGAFMLLVLSYPLLYFWKRKDIKES